jgi:hypothetical protein
MDCECCDRGDGGSFLRVSCRAAYCKLSSGCILALELRVLESLLSLAIERRCLSEFLIISFWLEAFS